MYASNELMFPPHVIPLLRHSRGPEWCKLVERVARLPEDHPDSLAFTLMMIRLNGCLECETDSFRAMRGCEACALQTLRRSKLPDKELMARYTDAHKDIVAYFSSDGRQRKAA